MRVYVKCHLCMLLLVCLPISLSVCVCLCVTCLFHFTMGLYLIQINGLNWNGLELETRRLSEIRRLLNLADVHYLLPCLK